MSPKAGFVLLEKIDPRLRAAIPHIEPMRAEDAEELLQDGLAMAAQLLHTVEERGEEVTPGNIAYYVVLHLKSGRCSQSASRSDVFSPATTLDGKSSTLSLAEPVGLCPETGETMELSELLAGAHEDPSEAAARNLDWAAFLEGRNPCYTELVRCAVQGQPANTLKGKLRVSDSALSDYKRALAADIREAMGEDVPEEVCRRPRWQADMAAEQERARCRYERQRQRVH